LDSGLASSVDVGVFKLTISTVSGYEGSKDTQTDSSKADKQLNYGCEQTDSAKNPRIKITILQVLSVFILDAKHNTEATSDIIDYKEHL
jgi:hypothetical protein